MEVLCFLLLMPLRDKNLICHDIPRVHQSPFIKELLLVHVILDDLVLLVLWVMPALMDVLENLEGFYEDLALVEGVSTFHAEAVELLGFSSVFPGL